jgi:hypothetical protein
MNRKLEQDPFVKMIVIEKHLIYFKKRMIPIERRLKKLEPKIKKNDEEYQKWRANFVQMFPGVID